MEQKRRTETCPATRPRRFYDCTLNEKLPYSSFLLLAGLADVMALACLYTRFKGIDSKHPEPEEKA